MPDKLTEILSFKITRKEKLELIKICKGLNNIPISKAARAAIGNFIAYRKRFGGGYYLCRGNKKRYRLSHTKVV